MPQNWGKTVPVNSPPNPLRLLATFHQLTPTMIFCLFVFECSTELIYLPPISHQFCITFTATSSSCDRTGHFRPVRAMQVYLWQENQQSSFNRVCNLGEPDLRFAKVSQTYVFKLIAFAKEQDLTVHLDDNNDPCKNSLDICYITNNDCQCNSNIDLIQNCAKRPSSVLSRCHFWELVPF